MRFITAKLIATFGFRVYRTIWIKDRFVFQMPAVQIPVKGTPLMQIYDESDYVIQSAYLAERGRSGNVFPYEPTPEDLAATDWEPYEHTLSEHMLKIVRRSDLLNQDEITEPSERYAVSR